MKSYANEKNRSSFISWAPFQWPPEQCMLCPGCDVVSTFDCKVIKSTVITHVCIRSAIGLCHILHKVESTNFVKSYGIQSMADTTAWSVLGKQISQLTVYNLKVPWWILHALIQYKDINCIKIFIYIWASEEFIYNERLKGKAHRSSGGPKGEPYGPSSIKMGAMDTFRDFENRWFDGFG